MCFDGDSTDNIEIECYIDNKSLYDSLHSSTNLIEENQLIFDISLIKSCVTRRKLIVFILLSQRDNSPIHLRNKEVLLNYSVVVNSASLKSWWLVSP